MDNENGVFSIRIAIADFYLEKPIYGLDPCYSEFRGREIKKVPIIRVFGANALGQKTCMHIHGVFPYFYIPYKKQDMENVNQAIFQIAMNIDKAINISLGQANSNAQHVFKVQLVKGIPFYGYHRSDHQFFKIYMFNPRFVKRAANLLQNGAIMGKTFHPHESHVPYILQFMIDFNLYGMSFLHVPMEIVKFRRNEENEEIAFKNLNPVQILDCSLIKKKSVSVLEVDIGSNFILNRFQLLQKHNSQHTNPGIEAIWNDEKVRRQKLIESLEGNEEKIKEIPALEVPATEERDDIFVSPYVALYRDTLIAKLESLTSAESTFLSDETMAPSQQSTTVQSLLRTSNSEEKVIKKKPFYLKGLLVNAVYPDECTNDEQQLTNASFIENHLSNNNLFQTTLDELKLSSETSSRERPVQEDENIFLDNTIVDEDLILSLSQHNVSINASLRQVDYELLDVLKDLEEVNENENENPIDLDSSLAQFSQSSKKQNYQKDVSMVAGMDDGGIHSDPGSDSEGDMTHDNMVDFSMALDDVNELLLKLTQTQESPEKHSNEKIPQLDGNADDDVDAEKRQLPRTPTKRTTKPYSMSPPKTPKHQIKPSETGSSPKTAGSPRTPKAATKYTQLPLIINNKSDKKNENSSAYHSSGSDRTSSKASTGSLRKSVALTRIRRKTFDVEMTNDVDESSATLALANRQTTRSAKSKIDLDKTHITCNLTPMRTNERVLKVYEIEQPEAQEKNRQILGKTRMQLRRHTVSCAEQKPEWNPNREESSKSLRSLRNISHNGSEKQLASDTTSNNGIFKSPNNTEQTLIKEKEANHTREMRNKIKTKIESDAKKDKTSKTSKPLSFGKGELKTLSPVLLNTSSESETQCKSLVVKLKRIEDSPLNLNAAHASALTLTKNTQDVQKVSDLSTECKQRRKESGEETANRLTVPTTARVTRTTRMKETKPSKVKTTEETATHSNQRQSKTTFKAPSPGPLMTSREVGNLCKSFVVKLKRTETTPETVHKTATLSTNNTHQASEFAAANEDETGKDEAIGILKRTNSMGQTAAALNVLNLLIHECKTTTDAMTGSTTSNAKRPNDDVGMVEEILSSDDETQVSLRLRKTPNLKRLQRHRLSLGLSRKKLNRSTDLLRTPTTSKRNTKPETPLPKRGKTSPSSSQVLNEMSDEEILPTDNDEPILLQSFYDQSFCLNSPSVFSTGSSPIIDAHNPELLTTPKLNSSLGRQSFRWRSASNTPTLKICKVDTPSPKSSQELMPQASCSDRIIKITPLLQPPTYDEVLAECEQYGLFKYDYQRPFYSDPNDITKPKEVGFNILYIPGNKLNDLPPFQSSLGDELQGLEAWRRKALVKFGGPLMLNRFKKPDKLPEFFASNRKIKIMPFNDPPTYQDAKLWLKARDLINVQTGEEEAAGQKKNIKELIEQDSPIKIKRQKITMMLNEDGHNDTNGSDQEHDLDTTLTLTPMTPMTPCTPILKDNKNLEMLRDGSFTPLTSLKLDGKASVLQSRKKPRLLKKSKVALNGQLNAIEMKESKPEAITSERSPSVISCSQGSAKNSQTSDSTVSSQTALAQMERSSFMRLLQSANPLQHDLSFGLSNATLDNTFGFKVKLENLQHARADIEFNYITTMDLEVFVPTRGDLYPDPFHDEIRCLFYAIENSIPSDGLQKLPRKACGYIIVHDHKDILPTEGRFYGLASDIEVQVVASELDLFQALVELVHKWDPDIFAGYEIEMSSWGYVIDRAKNSGFNISPMLSRIPTQKFQETVEEEREQFTDLDIEMKLNGRILLDVWRLMRSEIALTSYTFENVMYHIRHSRCPAHSYKDLTNWYNSCSSRWIVLEYYIERVRGTLAILDQLDLIGRTSEMAKLIGIQFYEILSRGSQFRVESMMLRIAKPKNIVPLSPSVQQRAHMRAPEYIALIMEPESRFYTDPVIVLDFQSLYPSVIIAYNYCFSTCIGRIEHLGSNTPFEFGASQLRVPPKMALKLAKNDLLNYSSCGIAFVKSSVREGILPRMLTEILNTRQMVKQSMKLHKNNSALQRILHSRQLGLKLMANVTYGYTAANFSGRMPAVEVGDSVVARGRDTLEESMSFVEKNPKWNVRVVYGDTDSMFLLVPGRSREEAFKIGEEIAEAVTKRNPHPIKLKLEKVYQPCILQTKKRYVGYMYETPDQKEPTFEAKGIETVRRDGCPAVGKMLEKVLRILFETKDVSLVKQYVNRQFTKLLQGKANIQDLIFAKEFRGLNGYRPTACVPALELTRKWIQTDPRRIPRSGERVPFLITNGPPGVPLIRLVRHPLEVLNDEGLKINAIYYITKAIIPPLNRCLLLIGADVNDWFAGLPRKLLAGPALSNANEVISTAGGQNQKKSTISQYFSSSNCLVECGRQTMQSICEKCLENKQKAYTIVQNKITKHERGYYTTMKLCQACCGRVGELACQSLECPVIFVLEKKRREMQQCSHMRSILNEKFDSNF